MKKIDIILIKELFLLRYFRQYSKQVMEDFCSYIDLKLSNYSYVWGEKAVTSYSEFISEFEQNSLACNPKDFAIRKHFKEYLQNFKNYIYDEKF